MPCWRAQGPKHPAEAPEGQVSRGPNSPTCYFSLALSFLTRD